MARVGRLKISYQLLETLLQLPEGVHIQRIFEDPTLHRAQTLDLVLEGEALPNEVKEGDIIPIVSLISSYDKTGDYKRTIS